MLRLWFRFRRGRGAGSIPPPRTEYAACRSPSAAKHDPQRGRERSAPVWSVPSPRFVREHRVLFERVCRGPVSHNLEPDWIRRCRSRTGRDRLSSQPSRNSIAAARPSPSADRNSRGCRGRSTHRPASVRQREVHLLREASRVRAGPRAQGRRRECRRRMTMATSMPIAPN